MPDKYVCTIVMVVNDPIPEGGSARRKVFLNSNEMNSADAAKAFGEAMMRNGAVAYRVRYRSKPTDTWVLYPYVVYEPAEVAALKVLRY